MSSFQSPRGTRDLLPDQQLIWQQVKNACQEVAEQMSYRPLSTPTFEEVGVFQRSLGKGTDIIDKEMFLVQGRQDESTTYALRPEGTAGIVRAYIQHGMQTWPQPVKLFSFPNLFRYERPQRGRYREHMQFDIEYFGDTSPFADAWIIYTHWRVLQKLELSDISLDLNSLGTPEERQIYIQALVNYLTPLSEQLSPDSKRRIAENPLRILDSKEISDQKLLETAPSLQDYLGEESKTHLAKVEEYLNAWSIPYQRNSRLVRGLDYYSHTCFEWVRSGSLSLGGGGRYDALVPQLGGPTTGAVGAGLGLDRVVDFLAEQGPVTNPQLDAYLVALPDTQKEASHLVTSLLDAGFSIDADFSKPSFNSQLKSANRSQARFALILGSDEAAQAEITVKNLNSGEQTRIPQKELNSFLHGA